MNAQTETTASTAQNHSCCGCNASSINYALTLQSLSNFHRMSLDSSESPISIGSNNPPRCKLRRTVLHAPRISTHLGFSKNCSPRTSDLHSKMSTIPKALLLTRLQSKTSTGFMPFVGMLAKIIVHTSAFPACRKIVVLDHVITLSSEITLQ